MTTNIKISVAVIAILFCLVGVKMHINQKLNGINDKVRERDLLLEEVKILEAELSYLNNIDRIEKLSSQYLSLNAVAKKVIVLGEETHGNEKANVIEAKHHHHNTNWRYKSRSNIMNVRHTVR
jgi:hypothetical protein